MVRPRPTSISKSLPRASTALRLAPALSTYSHRTFPAPTSSRAINTTANLRQSEHQRSPADLLAEYSELPTRTVRLSDLTQVQLLVGLAGRVTQHLALPFLPSTNPSLHKIYTLYYDAFIDLMKVPAPIKTLEDNDKLCDVMERMVDAHSDNIPILAKGFSECRTYLSSSSIQDFLDRAIRNRISLRLMAEQHIQLSKASLPTLRPSSLSDPKSLTAGRIGVLDLCLSPYELIDNCADFVSELCEATLGVAPRYRIEGISKDQTVGSIGSHLEYVLTELLKNAFRATVEHHTPKPPAADPDVFRFEDLPSGHLLKEDIPEVLISVGVVPGALTIRIRDRGGGVPPASLPNVFSYAFTSVSPLPNPDADPDSPVLDEGYGGVSGAGYKGGVGGGPEVPGNSPLSASMGTLAGLGFGLPLSRIYAQYFGGSLDLVSLTGYGCDAYLILRTTEAVPENNA